MTKGALTPAPSVPEVAVRLYAPAVLIEHPEKVTDPFEVFLGFWLHARVAPAGVVIASRTDDVPEVRLPPASCSTTVGWVAKAVPAVLPTGEVVKASFIAGPTETTKLELPAAVRVPEVAVSV
jgi:hypothetical protein